jgi:competence protein ComGC
MGAGYFEGLTMRAAFGLIGILVTLGVIVAIWYFISLPNIKQARQTQKKVEATLGALTSSGIQESKDSISLDARTRGGRFNGLIVKGIAPGGAMQVNYGLMTGDVIVGVHGNTFDAIANGDSDMAEALVWEARGRQQILMVERNGKKIDLPWQPAPELPPGAGPGAEAEAAAEAAGQSAGQAVKESPLKRQVKIATH